jgi:cathepsin A (carboxypeptidase C)
MLYLEAPAGVGFSYSQDTADYNTGDDQTAADNYVALQLFFKKYPQYLKHDFYVSGES